MKLKSELVFFLVVILSYGLLYSAYKFWVPTLGGNDFYQYYLMYESPLQNEAIAPFYYRQISAWITYLISNINIYYDTTISFQDISVNQSVFFSSIISSYIGILLTSYFINKTLLKLNETIHWTYLILSSTLVFLSFNIIPHVLTGLAESWSWFFYSFLAYLYISKKKILYIFVLFISIFQRETIVIVNGFIFFISIFLGPKENRLKSIFVWLISIIFFLAYIILRIYIFEVGGYENQLSINSILIQLMNFSISFDYIVPVFMSQNIFYIYSLSIIYYKFKLKKDYNIFNSKIIYILLTYIFLLLVGIGTGIGGNIGRIIAQLNPLIIIIMIYELTTFERNNSFI